MRLMGRMTTIQWGNVSHCVCFSVSGCLCRSLDLFQFLVPGDNHSNENHDSPTRTGWFPWASEVVPPPTETPDADNNDGRSEQPETEQEPVDSTAPDGGSGGTPWGVSVAVPPSREMRDGVRFQGLCVLLFVGDDEREAEVRKLYSADDVAVGCSMFNLRRFDIVVDCSVCAALRNTSSKARSPVSSRRSC